MRREKAISVLLDRIGPRPVIAGTGKVSREVFAYRRKSKSPNADFLVVGSFGCVLGVGIGVALNTDERIYVFDGDGAVLTQMGSLATVGKFKPNLVHVVFNNYCYDSTGGQENASGAVNWRDLFLSTGYNSVQVVDNVWDVRLDDIDVPAAIIIDIDPGSRRGLKRPDIPLSEIKLNFMEAIK